MALSVPIWKIYGFPKVSLYLENFVLKHATSHIHKRCTQAKKNQEIYEKFSEHYIIRSISIKLFPK
jgi:pyrroloquinoline quinone (PQQ) biosynthesis protein C